LYSWEKLKVETKRKSSIVVLFISVCFILIDLSD